MKISSRSRKTHHDINGSHENAHPHPNQLTCKVKGPDGNQVASVPIYLPLSIMASYAVTSKGGSDKLAALASDAVIAQGTSCARQMNSAAHVLDYINSLANHAHNAIMSKTGDRVIADEVKTMILGGGQLILNSHNNTIDNQCQESREDDANDAMTDGDIQSIATSLFSVSPVRSVYAVNDRVAATTKLAITHEPSFLSPTYSIDSVATNHTARQDEGTTSFMEVWACNTTKDTEIPRSSSLDKVLDGHQTKQSTDPTWDMSNNTNEYEATSTFKLDTFFPVPATFYKVPHDLLECPNLSMEPVIDNSEHIHTEMIINQDENDHGLIEKAVSSDYTMNSTGRGILAMNSHNNINMVAELQEATNSQPTNANRSVNTDNIQSQMMIGDCCAFNAPCSRPDTVIPQKHCDQTSSTKEPYDYQSSDDYGLEVDDITFLNAPKKKLPLLKRMRHKFCKWNCKSG